MRKNKIAKGILIVLGGTAFIVGMGFVLMYLWNWLMPAIFGLKTITFIQALGLFLLSKILFGFGGKGGGWKDRRHKHRDWARFRTKWESMTEQERQEFRDCRRGPFWKRKEETTVNNE